MSADGGEKREPLAKWAFRGACPSSFRLPVAVFAHRHAEVLFEDSLCMVDAAEAALADCPEQRIARLGDQRRERIEPMFQNKSSDGYIAGLSESEVEQGTRDSKMVCYIARADSLCRVF